MKILYIGLLLIFSGLTLVRPASAQTISIPPSDVSQQASGSSSSITTKSDANDTIPIIKNFVSSTDKLLGGFIFFTPDVFATTVMLKDGTVLPGLSTYRDIFYAISIPIVAIAIAFFALRRLNDDTPFAFKALLSKLLLVAVLFIITPTLLSYSIQANNLLVQKITSEQKFSQFITNFLDNEQQQIQKGADPQEFGIPNTQPTFFGGIVQSFWKFLLQSALFLIALFFFLIGILFIAFQFIIRFASLLFLSVLFPIAIPFALSEKTEGITNMYFKTWFTFLIHQPAFALGYMLATGFLSAILSTNGASLGMLFFYSGFLFFLGGVNTLVASIFGSSWTAIGSNVAASILTAPFGKSANEFKRGVMGPNTTSISNMAGQQVRRGLGAVRSKFAKYKTTDGSSSYQGGNQNSKNFVSRKYLEDLVKESHPVPHVQTQKNTQTSDSIKQNGTASMQSDGYSAIDTKKGTQINYSVKLNTQPQPESYKSSDRRLVEDKQSLAPRTKGTLQKETKKFKEEDIQGVVTKKREKPTKNRIKRINSQEPL
ncbi:MAG: hypothetical protein ACREHC_00800 [Candidatus Levyibacteriota bacterium]